jgi:hypothetical protein
MFPGGHQTRQAKERSNRILGSFARRVIVNQPLDYARAVGADFLRYFTPGAIAFNDAVSATSLPSNAATEPRNERDRRRVIAGTRPAVRPPASFLRSYRRRVHVPRPLLALLAIASLVAVALRTPARREVLLLAGSGLALLLGTAATAGFGFRYLLPAVPLLAIGGTFAVTDLGMMLVGHRRAAGKLPATTNPAAAEDPHRVGVQSALTAAPPHERRTAQSD